MIKLSYLQSIGFREYEPRSLKDEKSNLLIWYGSFTGRSFVVIIKSLTNSFVVEEIIFDIENSKEILNDLFGDVWDFEVVLNFIEKLMLLPSDFRLNHQKSIFPQT